jgi:hypothetical protein
VNPRTAAYCYATIVRDLCPVLVTYDTVDRRYRASAPGFGAYPSTRVDATIADAVRTWRAHGCPISAGIFGVTGMHAVTLDELIALVSAEQKGES